jgi:hypothetical protein
MEASRQFLPGHLRVARNAVTFVHVLVGVDRQQGAVRLERIVDLDARPRAPSW